ncbi:hypothetical protein CPB84DRAFT_1825362 [Gymnopilus junonius]|uniref:Cytochrome b561 and DOMON domain-containing protein n=1 Tax=Gymnopilus junonius TaxID=109634 RepID=A0A9P5NJQ1_GYMJU|nr:hypothetical protein CPB84DRAFT_1825362 [Gymnopilus junonius]
MRLYFWTTLWFSTTLVSATTLTSRQSSGLTGDRLCSSSMCVTAIVNGSVVEYVMSGTSSKVGWMAVGFGRAMGDSPMIIMWPNSDGTATITQRSSHGHSTPTIESSPPFTAEMSQAYTITSGSTPQLGFTIPSSSNDTKPFLIWAYSSTNPGSSSSDASINEHDDKGEWQLDLTRPLNFTSSPTNGTLPAFPNPPLYPYERLIVAHAILCILGFLLFLPAGALIARYLRVFNPIWFQWHWILQFAIAAPVIVIGIVLGIAAVQSSGALHFGDSHRKYGIGILVLYLAQCTLGGIIHFVKKKNRTRRPIQNYLHGVVGLVTIGVAMYQIYNGFHSEWQNTTGRGSLPGGLTVLFFVWSVILLVAYLAGLAFLPRQYRQERDSRAQPLQNSFDEDDAYIPMNSHHKLPLNNPTGSYQD